MPAKIISINSDDANLLPAIVDFGGICKSISLCFTPEAKIGDYVLVHVGFAISIIDEQHAKQLIEFLDQESLIGDEVSN